MSMFVVPHMSMPMPSPMRLMTVTAIVLPVAHSTPPATACGMNLTEYASTRPFVRAARQPPAPGTQSAELCRKKSTSWSTRPQQKMAEHMTHWKNMPSPVSKRFTGTKLVPKKSTAIATATYPVASPAPGAVASCASHTMWLPSLSVPSASVPSTLDAPPKGERSTTTAPVAGVKLPRTLQKSKPSSEPTMVKRSGPSNETMLVPANELAW